MISAKILVQSASASLITAAVFTLPSMLLPESSVSFNAQSTSADEAAEHAALEARYAQHVFRAAPPAVRANPARAAKTHSRTIEQRNQAARMALDEIDHTYERQDARRRAVGTAHTVARHSQNARLDHAPAITTRNFIDRAMASCAHNDKDDIEGCRMMERMVGQINSYTKQ